MRRALIALGLSLFATALFAQADQQIVSATDAPDPVVPGNNVTYTVQLRNNGPNPAVNGGINIVFDSNVTFLPGSSTIPAGFICVGGQFATCSIPSFAPGDVTFQIVAQVAPHLINFADGSVTTSFSTSGVTPDPVGGNNSASVTTAYDSPQMDLGISVTDNPDPVTPNNNITYTATVTQTGPNAATNVNFNVFNNGSLRFQSATVPAGWNCTLPAVNATPTFTCTKASVPAGTNEQLIVVVRADQAVLGINDGSVSTAFGVNGTGHNTNTSNDLETETTGYVTPDADVQITATDSPDPVAPDGDITYTVTVSNAGPDTAPNMILNVPMNNTLRFTSVTTPAGWTCTPPAVGAGTSWSCSNPSFASGASSVFTIVLRANDEQFGINDQTIVQHFGANSGVSDPNNANNGINVSTSYVAADADIQLTATDSPDPVAPDGDITYTVTVTNAGPDTAPNMILNVPMNNTLRFQSVTTPAGWTCTPPAVGAGTSWSCSRASFPSGTTSQFTIVLRANDEQFGINDQTIVQHFGANSAVADPNNANNGVNVSTTYSTPDAEMQIAVTDAPDPVVNGANLTFTINVTNAGPNAGPGAVMNASPHESLQFQSVTTPAGWTCTTPAVNVNGLVQCTNPSFPNGGTAQFILVTKLVTNGPGGTLASSFGTGSTVQDPNNTNNAVTIFTNWIGQSSDLSITKSTLATAVAQGGTITYTLSTSNAGPDAAANVTVTDVLPVQLRFQSITAPAGWVCTTPAVGANGTVSCTTPVLANGASANFTLVTTVAPNATGTITNSASVGHSGGSDPTPGNSSGSSGAIIVGGNADLAVTKTTPATNVAVGGTITYTISFTNNGPDPAASTTMTDILPASLLFQSITAPAGWTCVTPAVGTNGTVTCGITSLASGTTAMFTLVTTVASGATGTISNSASGTHSGTDGTGGNNTGTTTPGVIVMPVGADLTVTKSTATTTIAQGTSFFYTILLTNNGPDAATAVVMNDVLPASLLFQSITAPAGFTCTTPAVGTNGTVNCTAATLASGAQASFTLTVRVTNTATGTIVNNVTVTSGTTDPNGGNNGSTTPPIPVTPGGPGEGQTQIPTLSEWALIALALAIAAFAARRL
jgi:uncharacterized repeat protein (TIGR01451 family)